MPANIVSFLQKEFNISKYTAEKAWKEAKNIYLDDYGKSSDNLTDKDYKIITTIAKNVAKSMKENFDNFIESEVSAEKFLELITSSDFPQLKQADIVDDNEDEEENKKIFNLMSEEKTDDELRKSAKKMAKNSLGDNASEEEIKKLANKFFKQMSKKDKMNEKTP